MNLSTIKSSASTIPPSLPPKTPDLSGDHLAAVESARRAYADIQRELSKVIVGQPEVVEQILIAIFTRSHALLVGVPGLAKTLIVSTLARIIQTSFKRIQFTPDLMPSDITGTEVIYEDKSTGAKHFKFLPGPLFANIVLADEINRTPPKTQAAMLEAMQERSVTVGGNTYELPKPFFVLATQNPLEQEGTYVLPEAQLDRFLFLINVDYPSTDEELDIMRRASSSESEAPQAILSVEQILKIQATVKLLPVGDHVYRYAQRLAACTRTSTPEVLDFCKEYLSFGAGPRASLGLILAAQAHALIHGQAFVSNANVAAVALPVLRHRLAVNFAARSENLDADAIIRRILKEIPSGEA
jgi:MoxR-like ATPase